MPQHRRFSRFYWVGFACVLVLLLTNPCHARLTLAWIAGGGSLVTNDQEANLLSGAEENPATDLSSPAASHAPEITPIAEQPQGQLEWIWPEFLFAGLLLLLVLGGLWQWRRRRKERLLRKRLPDLGERGPSPEEQSAPSAVDDDESLALADESDSSQAVDASKEAEADTSEARENSSAEASTGNANVSGPFRLQGDLGAARVLDVLQMLANYEEPVTLVICNPHYEKRLHFRHGHVVEVSSFNLVKKSKVNFLMNKLGYILVRERKISEEQRDQALDLCEADPQLRIGEALLQLGALKKKELLDALRRQAEGVVFSLFLFPEGEYELVPEKLKIAEEDALLMPVTGLLQDAAQNASEWDRIRTAIPSLNTVLDFSPTGREKSDNARLTVHQKMILALVDGKRTVQDICVEATMLDFEVYRFLYLMLYAKILRRVN